MTKELESYFDRIFPLNRSLTGDGNRKTLKILQEIADIKIKEIPSLTTCFDWEVPPEYNVKEAWIKDQNGKKIVDFAKLNLHLLGYSEPIHKKLSFKELKEHIYTLPYIPDAVPYVTSYYERKWGFCMAHDEFLNLDKTQEYEVKIDANFNEKGSMSIGEIKIKGKSKKEILFSTYICHPSMANNETSGMLVNAFLARKLKEKKNLRYSYRFLFVPETIGSIYTLWKKGKFFKKNLKAGYIVTCVGDKGKFTYKKSAKGDTLADRAAICALKDSKKEYELVDFYPTGSDERQYCSPGFDLPVGSLMRTRYGYYSQYHTSKDDKSVICFESLKQSIDMYLSIINLIEHNEKLVNQKPYCEPKLSKYGLYPTLSQKYIAEQTRAIAWILNQSNGKNDLIDIVNKSGISLELAYELVEKLKEKGILSKR